MNQKYRATVWGELICPRRGLLSAFCGIVLPLAALRAEQMGWSYPFFSLSFPARLRGFLLALLAGEMLVLACWLIAASRLAYYARGFSISLAVCATLSICAGFAIFPWPIGSTALRVVGPFLLVIGLAYFFLNVSLPRIHRALLMVVLVPLAGCSLFASWPFMWLVSMRENAPELAVYLFVTGSLIGRLPRMRQNIGWPNVILWMLLVMTCPLLWKNFDSFLFLLPSMVPFIMSATFCVEIRRAILEG